MPESTTIRVSTDTRRRLNALASRRGEPAGEVVAKLVSAADDELLLGEAEAAFAKLAGDADAGALYRAETREIEDGFEARTPDW